MPFRACHLIVVLLAVLSFLSPASDHVTARSAGVVLAAMVPQGGWPAATQDPNPVSIRPREATASPGLPNVQVTVNRHRVPVDYVVTFTLGPASVVGSRLFTIVLNFGDGKSQEIHQTEVTHPYHWPGHYIYSVSVKSADDKNAHAPQAPRVSLSARPTPVAPLSPVAFNAQLSSSYPNIKYRFVFGDKSQTDWLDTPQTSHAYASAERYLAYVDIGSVNNGVIKPIGGSVRQPILVIQTQLGAVELIAIPSTVDAGASVTFYAQVESKDPNVQYRFVFGDRSQTDWQGSSQTTHKYSLAGSYPAYVDVRLGNGRVSTSKTTEVSVTPLSAPSPSPRPASSSTPGPNAATPNGSATPTPGGSATPTPTPDQSATPSPGSASTATPGGASTTSGGASTPNPFRQGLNRRLPPGLAENWWKYLLIILLALFIAYRAVKLLFPPRVIFVPHIDPGVAALSPESGPMSIDFQLQLNPNVAEGEYGLETFEDSFIRSERSSDG